MNCPGESEREGMGDDRARIFSLAEANEAVREVCRLTQEAILRIDEARKRCGCEGAEAELPAEVLRQVEDILYHWAECIEELGAYPKGYFTVDFRSAEPGLLYCWTFGEESIRYTHRNWEDFSHRKPLVESIRAEGEHLRWVN